MSHIQEFVEGMVHEDTQVHDGVVDLTLKSVSQVVEAGRVDFGGGELEDAKTADVATEKRSRGDQYGWWNLPGGLYLLTFNETLNPPEDARIVVQTRRELRERGATHPTFTTRNLGRVSLTVPQEGVRIKENARVSTVVGILPTGRHWIEPE